VWASVPLHLLDVPLAFAVAVAVVEEKKVVAGRRWDNQDSPNADAPSKAVEAPALEGTSNGIGTGTATSTPEWQKRVDSMGARLGLMGPVGIKGSFRRLRGGVEGYWFCFGGCHS
jgi:hypothetical protein